MGLEGLQGDILTMGRTYTVTMEMDTVSPCQITTITTTQLTCTEQTTPSYQPLQSNQQILTEDIRKIQQSPQTYYQNQTAGEQTTTTEGEG